jgi:hexulose-6-phosphate isomerase
MSRLIGIMQGRLSVPEHGRIQSFPIAAWREEFPRAAEAGLQAIEWIYDVEDTETNPICTDAGIEKIRRLSKQHNIIVQSLCADYFMPFPLVRATDAQWGERLKKFEWLLQRCHAAGIIHVILPFVDNSRIDTPKDRADVLKFFEKIKPSLERLNLEVHLETSLGPEDFRSLIEAIGNPRVKVNYDSGNSSSLGYAFEEEWNAYGKMIGSVHIKDRVKGGSTVPLGTGSADFGALACSLKKFGYDGRYVLQVARDKNGDEVNWARKNRAFLENLLDQKV